MNNELTDERIAEIYAEQWYARPDEVRRAPPTLPPMVVRFARAIESALRAHPAAAQPVAYPDPVPAIAISESHEFRRCCGGSAPHWKLSLVGSDEWEHVRYATHAEESLLERLYTAPAAQEEASEPDYWAVLREDGSGVLVQRDKPDAPEWQRAKPDAADWDAAYPGLAPHTVVPLFLAPAASAPPNLQHVGNRLNVLFDVFLRAGESPAKALELAFDGVKPMFSAASAPRTGEGSAIEGVPETQKDSTKGGA